MMPIVVYYCAVLCAILRVGIAAPTTNITSTPNEPCAVVASTVAELISDQPPAFGDQDTYPRIPAEIAIQCLRSVPFNATFAIEWLESLKPYLQWQSTLAYLKDPPPGYWREPYDLPGQLDLTLGRVMTVGYDNEFDFELDLYKIFARAFDGHMRYFPMIFNGIFSWGRPVPLVSISADGKTLPRPYVYNDVLTSLNDSSFIPSPVTRIYDQDAEKVLRDTSLWSTSVDWDASYNSLFMNLAQSSLGYLGNGAGTWAGGGRGAVQYPGSHVNMTFENGTVGSWQNFARVLQDFSGIKTGQDLRERFLPATSTSPWLPVGTDGSGSLDNQQSDTVASANDGLRGPAGYPRPVKLLPGNYVAGYYVVGQGYENLAVLSLPSFGGPGSQQDFQQTVFDFLAQAKKDGKTKLIVDLSANGGGQIPQAYSVFKNLFPDIDPYGGNRFRAFKDFDLIGQIVTETVGTAYPWKELMPPGPGLLMDDFLATPFIATADMDAEGHAFGSWAQKYGPHEYNGDQFTSIIRWNLSDPALAKYAGFDPNKYGKNSTVLSERPFAAEDVIILTDGYCASSCAIFVELMTQQAKVKTVAVGGMAGTTIGPMQAVGGVRGVNVYEFYSIGLFARHAASLAKGTPRQAILDETYTKYSSIPLDRSADTDGRLNVRDNIREGDDEQIPLQFRYERADCRIFYEKEHTVDVTTLWKSVYDVSWSGDTCAEGSISPAHPSRRQASSSFSKRHSMRKMQNDEVKHLKDAWRYGSDVNKIKPMRGFQLP